MIFNWGLLKSSQVVRSQDMSVFMMYSLCICYSKQWTVQQSPVHWKFDVGPSCQHKNFYWPVWCHLIITCWCMGELPTFCKWVCHFWDPFKNQLFCLHLLHHVFELIDMDVIIHVKWGITKQLVNMDFVRPSTKNVALSLPVSGKILVLGSGKIIQCPWSQVNKCMVLGCVIKENIHVN